MSVVYSRGSDQDRDEHRKEATTRMTMALRGHKREKRCHYWGRSTLFQIELMFLWCRFLWRLSLHPSKTKKGSQDEATQKSVSFVALIAFTCLYLPSSDMRLRLSFFRKTSAFLEKTSSRATSIEKSCFAKTEEKHDQSCCCWWISWLTRLPFVILGMPSLPSLLCCYALFSVKTSRGFGRQTISYQISWIITDRKRKNKQTCSMKRWRPKNSTERTFLVLLDTVLH